MDREGDGGARIDRRRAAGLFAAGAGAAWVAPTVLSYDAAAAAGSLPGCPVCSVDDLVKNPGAESGVVAPWTAVGTSPSLMTVQPWTDLQAFGLEPPAGVGTNAFAVFGSPAAGDIGIAQVIEFGPGCEAALVELSAVLGAVTWEGDGASTIAVSVTFRDAADTDLGPGTVATLVATANPGQLTDFATLQTTSGSMPAGAVKVLVTALWSGHTGTANPALVIGAVDDISVTFSCIV